MRLTAIVAAVVSLGVLAGCQPEAKPSAPPTSEPALTTSTPEVTLEPAPTTEAPAPTSAEPAPTTEEAEAGPPEMPDEAKEQTEEGAEAFVEHYLDMLNYTGQHPQTGHLEPLGAEGCKSCRNYEDNVETLVEQGQRNDGPALTISGTNGIGSSATTIVLADIEQLDYDVLDTSGDKVRSYESRSGQLKFTLEPAEPWLVAEVQVAASP